MTAKTIDEVIVADVTIESATKAKRLTKEGEKVEWKLRFFAPTLGIKDYSTPTSMDVTWATDLMAGETHRVKLRRGRLKQNQDGSAKSSQYDSNYWWDIAEWDTQADISAAPVSATGHGPSASSQEDFRRSKEEMRLLDCLLIEATRLSGTSNGTRDAVWTGGQDYYAWVTDWEAERRASAQDAPRTEVAEPPEEAGPVSSPPAADGPQMIRDSARQFNDDVRAKVREGRLVTPSVLSDWVNQLYQTTLEALTPEQALAVATAIANGDLGEPDDGLPF